MAVAITTALVFERDVRRPVELREQAFLGPEGSRHARSSTTWARLWQEEPHVYRIEASGPVAVAVNGRGIPERPLRDGDEIVVRDRACVFRQALADSDLEHHEHWEMLETERPVDFLSDATVTLLKVLKECGFPGTPERETVVEDYRNITITIPHFGFGRRRSLLTDPGYEWGLDCSYWDVVGSGKPSFVRQRLTSLGLAGVVLKWDLRRRSREDWEPFVSETLLVGSSDPVQRKTVREALKVPFGSKLKLVPASDQALWMMNHTDRILTFPGEKNIPDHRINSSISRL